MATVDTQPPAEAAVPDYLASPNAVFDDAGVQWRYGKAPDYSKTRAVWEETKKMNHVAGSLPQLVENLVKNWEVEASFKPRLEDWRTIDHANYTFAINGGPPQTAEHMLKVGTYNAIVAANDFYSPENSDFASSHKTFKRMMPTFAWEVLEVYSGPPKVSFRWRHWGEMKNDYVGFNDKGEKITAKAHGGSIDIEGVTVAEVDDKVRLRKVETWFDPMEMFRQIAPKGIVNRQIMDHKVSKSDALEGVATNDGIKIAEAHQGVDVLAPEDVIPRSISQSTGKPADAFVPHQGTAEGFGPKPAVIRGDETIQPEDEHGMSKPNAEEPQKSENKPENKSASKLEDQSQSQIQPEAMQDIKQDYTSMPGSFLAEHAEHEHSSAQPERADPPSPNGAASDSSDKTWEKIDGPEEMSKALESDQPKDMEQAVKPDAGEAVVADPQSDETRATHEEMSRITPMECPYLMNRE